MKKEKGKGKKKGKGAAIDEKSGIKQKEKANSSGIEKKKEVQHIGETSHCVERKARDMHGVPGIWVKAKIGQLGDLEIYWIADALDIETAQNQNFVPNLLGHVTIKGYFADECLMVEEITFDFKDWYSSKCNDFKTVSFDDWWKQIEHDLKKLLRGIVRLFAKLSPDFSHGNVMGSVPILYGKLYNMTYDGYKRYQRDIENLYHIMKNVLMRVPPEEFCSSAVWHMEWDQLVRLYEGSHLQGFDNFMSDLKNGYKGKKQILWYRPFFWSNKERLYFMEKIYEIFWVEKDLLPHDARRNLNQCFPFNWCWWLRVPDGPFRRVFDHGGGESKRQYKRMVDSIPFCRHSKYHYNNKVEKHEEYKTVEEIETELNETLEICSHVFTAICKFIDQASTLSAYRTVRQRLIALGEEMGFFPINGMPRQPLLQ